MAGARLRFVDEGAKPVVHRATTYGRGVGVDPSCEQRMSETHSATVDFDDPSGFGISEKRDEASGGSTDGACDDLCGGNRQASHGEQRLADVVVEAVEPGADQFRKRGR